MAAMMVATKLMVISGSIWVLNGSYTGRWFIYRCLDGGFMTPHHNML